MPLADFIVEARRELQAKLRHLQDMKAQHKNAIDELDPSIQSAKKALDDFDADVTLLPARLKPQIPKD